jgi:hypothetical protein
MQAFGRLLRLSASPGDAIARDRAMEETDIRHILPTVQVPTLVLHRTHDRRSWSNVSPRVVWCRPVPGTCRSVVSRM